MSGCRLCGGVVEEFLDLGPQPLPDAFLSPDDPAGIAAEFFHRLAVGRCGTCTVVQLTDEIPREQVFHHDYPYRSASGSSAMREHFTRTALGFVETELSTADPFFVEIGCNDGTLLRTGAESGIRHRGFEPSGGVAKIARERGVRVRTEFFEESTAAAVREAEGPADMIYSSDTISQIPYTASLLRGVDALLSPGGVFVFEDPYLRDMVEKTSFDQICNERFYLFSVRSVQAMAERFGFELVDAVQLPTYGGGLRYTLARAGARRPAPSVARLLAQEVAQGLAESAGLQRFASSVTGIRDDLVGLLRSLREDGRTVVGYGATAKSATVTNFCGIGPDLVPYVCDTTPAKQHLLTPGMHIPVKPPAAFSDPYPDYALLFAWNHAEEIMAKEQRFREAGGRWIVYVPEVRVI
ncbi:class I SAM-dependent methyltransferase [Streptomyces jumonjinensis]|uniref:Class I SAM-dependent methyltransferase n=1 Tax=Streptomyces jumonjinensis TaxID=1945 RepID=A0A646KQ94_STRJU|nr:class I SAM-dependent methyltransferase [Streptomyces jumonjinensis]MQT04413.1 class I SAM-dependent methyltransferase [Streptomyces jumonjinensis]